MAVFKGILDAVAIGFEIGGLIVLLSSGLIALARWLRVSMPEFWRGAFNPEQKIRFEFGHQIVFALEFFIGADIIRSIQAPTFAELAKLGIIVIIRTVLHYSLR